MKPLPLEPDIRDLLNAFFAEKVEFLVVGAYAVGIHGIPRATQDFDLFVNSEPENAKRCFRALQEFGAPLSSVTAEDFESGDLIYQMGVAPGRIDIMTSISGVDFATAWANRIIVQYDGLALPFIGFKELMANKAASGRPKDALDLKILQDACEQ